MTAQGAVLRIVVVLDIVLSALNMSVENYGWAIFMMLLAVVNITVVDYLESGEENARKN